MKTKLILSIALSLGVISASAQWMTGANDTLVIELQQGQKAFAKKGYLNPSTTQSGLLNYSILANTLTDETDWLVSHCDCQTCVATIISTPNTCATLDPCDGSAPISLSALEWKLELTPSTAASAARTGIYSFRMEDLNSGQEDTITYVVNVDSNNYGYDGGSIGTCSTGGVSVIEYASPTFTNIHPNPANSSIAFDAYGIEDMNDIQIIDMSGKLVKGIPYSSVSMGSYESIRLDISSFQSGVYFIKMSEGDSQGIKFIKQ